MGDKVRKVNIDKDAIKSEELNAVLSVPTIELKTSKVNCDYCQAPLEYIKRDKGSETFVIYTRDGTKLGKHLEYRCTNRKSCRKGHYYGYSVSDKKLKYDQDCLSNEYLVTSRQTAFSTKYLYDITLQILFSNSSFQALAKIYNALHFTTSSGKAREEIFQERITDAFFLYSLIEIVKDLVYPPLFSPD